jgi:pSer/pThr/pTyr-binding forkhead associated (FHA) protein
MTPQGPASRDGSTERAAEGTTERVEIVTPPEAPARPATPEQPALPPPPEAGRYLEVQGPVEARLVRLQPGSTRIGRGLAADLRLDENSVSRRHAVLVNEAEGARILDDRSSNGTYVNGHRVEQAELHDGDTVMLGRVAMRYIEI